MKKFKFIIVLFVAAMIFGACEKENYNLYTTITGTVVHVDNGEPLAGVSVTLSPTGKSYVTGSDGMFEFADLDAQQYTVTVQKSGYVSNRKIVTGVAGETVNVTITMEPIE